MGKCSVVSVVFFVAQVSKILAAELVKCSELVFFQAALRFAFNCCGAVVSAFIKSSLLIERGHINS